jgi:hypothetical protein
MSTPRLDFLFIYLAVKGAGASRKIVPRSRLKKARVASPGSAASGAGAGSGSGAAAAASAGSGSGSDSALFAPTSFGRGESKHAGTCCRALWFCAEALSPEQAANTLAMPARTNRASAKPPRCRPRQPLALLPGRKPRLLTRRTRKSRRKSRKQQMTMADGLV